MSAIISECGKYRFRLEREIQPIGNVCAYFGVNPSTADSEVEDATTRKWNGFSLRNGFRRYIVGNAFAYRATDVSVLSQVPLGSDDSASNLAHIGKIIKDADILVPCWGSRKKLHPSLWTHLTRIKIMIFESGKPVMIFGLTQSGDPKHPLMLGYDTRLIPWVESHPTPKEGA